MVADVVERRVAPLFELFSAVFVVVDEVRRMVFAFAASVSTLSTDVVSSFSR